MDATTLIASLKEAVPSAACEAAPSVDLHTTVFVPADEFRSIAEALRDRPDLRFTLLADVTAADFYPREPRFEIVYHLVSIEHRHRARVKVRLHGDAAHLPSVVPVWAGANWLEREVWDMFGVVFDEHPDPRRLLMPEDWDGYPLRKDYPVQIRKTPTATEPLQVTADEFRQSVERDRL